MNEKERITFLDNVKYYLDDDPDLKITLTPKDREKNIYHDFVEIREVDGTPIGFIREDHDRFSVRIWHYDPANKGRLMSGDLFVKPDKQWKKRDINELNKCVRAYFADKKEFLEKQK
jgi:hypothetical protein